MANGDGLVLVVGAGSGMGRRAAQRLADAGSRVVAVDRNDAGLKETARDRPAIECHTQDVTDFSGVDALVGQVLEHHGRPFDRVYNAAAIQPTSLLIHQDVDEIHRVMAVNYGGLVNVSKAVLPHMLAARTGSLINFASIAGWVPNMHFGAYSASKFACVAFTEVLHHENRETGVHICCVCPSQVDTPLRSQALSKPRIMQTGPAPMSPDAVLDAIDRAVAKRRFWVFPGLHTAIGWRLRRFLPGLMWRIDHGAEGF